MSYISTLNLLGDDSPIPITEEALNEELALWANAQFTFDTKPGSALPDDSYKTVGEQHELLATLAKLNDNESLYDSIISPNTTTTPSLPRLAPAPQLNMEKLPIQSLLNKDYVTTTTKVSSRKRKSSSATISKGEDQDNVDDDKRKRNTAASARFRMKKKLREQALERTAKEMTLKAEALEKKVLELEKEAKWLRALVIEKDPTLLHN